MCWRARNISGSCARTMGSSDLLFLVGRIVHFVKIIQKRNRASAKDCYVRLISLVN